MPRLFIGNCTKQTQEFIYWVPESRRTAPVSQKIPIGGQIALTDGSSGDFSIPQITGIVDQHIRYGLVNVKDIDKSKEFVGTCYSIGEPVRINKLLLALELNEQILFNRGVQIRKDAAIMQESRTATQMVEAAMPNLLKFETTIQEENRDERDPNPPIAEGIRIDRVNAPKDAPRPPARRRKAG